LRRNDLNKFILRFFYGGETDMAQVTIAYYTTNHGVTQQQKGVEAVYYGKTFKIAKALFSEEGEVDFQKDIEDLLTDIREKGLEPVLDEATIERYETREIGSGDVWVMYRVPCKKRLD
jgi:hypothetical protein